MKFESIAWKCEKLKNVLHTSSLVKHYKLTGYVTLISDSTLEKVNLCVLKEVTWNTQHNRYLLNLWLEFIKCIVRYRVFSLGNFTVINLHMEIGAKIRAQIIRQDISIRPALYQRCVEVAHLLEAVSKDVSTEALGGVRPATRGVLRRG